MSLKLTQAERDILDQPVFNKSFSTVDCSNLVKPSSLDLTEEEKLIINTSMFSEFINNKKVDIDIENPEMDTQVIKGAIILESAMSDFGAKDFSSNSNIGGIELPNDVHTRILEKITNVLSYKPRLGVLGKTGAGKSSLCNALFGKDASPCNVSDVTACTRNVQELHLGIGNTGITLLDVPGVGENNERNKEYATLYNELIPTLDLVFWVIKGDDRALSVDENFYNKIVKPNIGESTKLLIILNQVDKIEPFREWDENNRLPGAKQAQNIDLKRKDVAKIFNIPLSKVLAVSAGELYGLSDLLDEAVHILPANKKAGVVREAKEEWRTETSITEAKSGVVDFVVDLIFELPVVSQAIPKSLKSQAKRFVSNAVDYIGDKIASLKFW